ncbi:transcription initiation factor IIB 2 [Haladaptatus sp. R4]|uniref:transcription initiation factor IIB n=1 Tax=Haladaptatus sp. R4 TaxID=1679489 RepID=UPI0007B4AB08|nr:TFIIB-type zinc ribbon-containing protein [Haladaptatus sp. R4]KZN22784.1 transcription initiation factor IIB 2 [Haladaptatus sp. R4]
MTSTKINRNDQQPAANIERKRTGKHRPEREEQRTDEQTREPEVCPECGGNLVADSEHAETVCSECGLVVQTDGIDRGPEWRAFDASERDSKSRVGMPTTKMMHDKGLSSNIGWQNKDAHGRSLSPRQREKMQRLRTWDERFRTRDSKERNLKQALGEIDRMASALGLPDNVREMASVIYRRALNEDLLPGRSIEGVATASLYAAARQSGIPRTMDEMTTVSRIDGMEFKRTYRYIVRELNLGVQPADPEQYLSRFESEFDLTPATKRRAHDLLKTAKETGATSGKSPVGLAAAALYAAALLEGENLTQDAVSEVSDVSTVTIRNRYHDLLTVADETDALPTSVSTDEAAA